MTCSDRNRNDLYSVRQSDLEDLGLEPTMSISIGTMEIPVYVSPDIRGPDGEPVHGRVRDVLYDGIGFVPTIFLAYWDPEARESVRVLFHEMIHALESLYGLDLEEEEVLLLERILPDLLIQNADLATKLLTPFIGEEEQEEE